MAVWDELQYSTLRPKARKIAKNETKSFNLVINVPDEAVPGSWSKTVIFSKLNSSNLFFLVIITICFYFKLSLIYFKNKIFSLFFFVFIC